MQWKYWVDNKFRTVLVPGIKELGLSEWLVSDNVFCFRISEEAWISIGFDYHGIDPASIVMIPSPLFHFEIELHTKNQKTNVWSTENSPFWIFGDEKSLEHHFHSALELLKTDGMEWFESAMKKNLSIETPHLRVFSQTVLCPGDRQFMNNVQLLMSLPHATPSKAIQSKRRRNIIENTLGNVLSAEGFSESKIAGTAELLFERQSNGEYRNISVCPGRVKFNPFNGKDWMNYILVGCGSGRPTRGLFFYPPSDVKGWGQKWIYDDYDELDELMRRVVLGYRNRFIPWFEAKSKGATNAELGKYVGEEAFIKVDLWLEWRKMMWWELYQNLTPPRNLSVH
jgi:hypothetical protein